MASASIDLLIGKIISVLENEASILGGVHDEIESIKLELTSMRSFVEDAERKGALSEGEKTWVASVRDIAYDVEDIIDEFMYHMNRKRNWGKYSRFFHQTISIPNNLWMRHQMGTKLQNINGRIKAIPETIKRYGVDRFQGMSSHFDSQWVKNHGESSLFIEDEDIVGVEKGKHELVGLLLNGLPQTTVVSVVGMGGSGKTTLVANIYNSQIVKQHFDCCAWITVSQNYVIEDLFRVMIKEFNKAAKKEVLLDLSTMTYRELVEMLVNFLRPKRYLIVLDDVWSMNLWTEINVALPNDTHGSRVMLTTRKEDVATFTIGKASHVYHIQPLGKNDAWALFCMKAFSSNPNRICPAELEILAGGLVEKCEGLPLAIVALGGLMSTRKLESDWWKLYNSLNSELSNNPRLQAVKSILLLSFNDLPSQLKHCFLYCCLFPEDCMIRRKRLIRLWIAEGFVKQVRGATLEEEAESYLMELICRNMLQVVMINPCGRPKACKMHDLMREFAFSISETEKFCAVYDGNEATDETVVRRLAIQMNNGEIKSGKGFSQQLRSLRSFFLFVSDKFSNTSLDSLLIGVKLLRVLDLEDSSIDNLPNEVVNLFNLRYLNLTRTQVKLLPKSIGKLCNLQTLDIKESRIRELPDETVKLQNLRHLIMFHHNLGHGTDFNYAFGTRAPLNICKLKNLQVLAGVEVEGNFIERLKNMTQLTRIILTRVRKADEKDLCIAIEKMKLLRFLFVKATTEEEPLRMDALTSVPPFLAKLKLVGKLEKVPRWFNSLQSLTFLVMSWSRLREDPLPHIQALPNLARLILVNAYVGTRLCFLKGFQKLKVLSIHRCPDLNEIVIEKGVMPSVQNLALGRCMQLKTFPHGIEHLTSLQELNLIIVSNELVERIRGEGSVDRPKVRHISKISHYYQTGSGLSYDILS